MDLESVAAICRARKIHLRSLSKNTPEQDTNEGMTVWTDVFRVQYIDFITIIY